MLSMPRGNVALLCGDTILGYYSYGDFKGERSVAWKFAGNAWVLSRFMYSCGQRASSGK